MEPDSLRTFASSTVASFNLSAMLVQRVGVGRGAVPNIIHSENQTICQPIKVCIEEKNKGCIPNLTILDSEHCSEK